MGRRRINSLTQSVKLDSSVDHHHVTDKYAVFSLVSCTEARDRIYGMLGMLPMSESVLIKVDYGQPVLQLYLEACIALSRPWDHHILTFFRYSDLSVGLSFGQSVTVVREIAYKWQQLHHFPAYEEFVPNPIKWMRNRIPGSRQKIELGMGSKSQCEITMNAAAILDHLENLIVHGQRLSRWQMLGDFASVTEPCE